MWTLAQQQLLSPLSPLRSVAPSSGDAEAGIGSLLVPLSLKERESDEDSDVKVVSSVGDAPRDRSPLNLSPQAPSDKDKSNSSSTDTSDVSSDSIEQSTSPSAVASENDRSNLEGDEEDEPESSNYRVTPEEPKKATDHLGVPAETKLIDGKLMSGGHGRQFLVEAGSSFSIPHEDEQVGTFGAEEVAVACGDLTLKSFIASHCLARKFEQTSGQEKESTSEVVCPCWRNASLNLRGS